MASTRCVMAQKFYISGKGEEMARIEGTVQWFDSAKGYGFIRLSDGGKDIFVHHSAIDMDGYKTLEDGQNVSFDVVQGNKGLQASEVRVI
jgi:CspA family cold shock protein